jgi:hypothetical protein
MGAVESQHRCKHSSARGRWLPLDTIGGLANRQDVPASQGALRPEGMYF